MIGEHYVSCVPTAIKMEHMRVIRNLIEVKIPEDQLNSANFKDGVKIMVRSQKPFTVNAYWIVKIRDIHMEIEKDWRTMRNQLREDKFLGDESQSLCRNPQIDYDATQEQVECEIKPPKEIDTSQMTTTPRDFYPLVIIVTCHEEELDPMASDAAANIHIVHIKDSVVSVKSHVIKNYIKQIDGRILDVSQLYVEESIACFICFEEASPEENLKLLCLLPCRHSPICTNCIGRIRECPKCRCPIASVFDINAPSAKDVAQQEPPRGTIDPNLSHLYDDANSDRNRSERRHQGGFFASIKSLFGL